MKETPSLVASWLILRVRISIFGGNLRTIRSQLTTAQPHLAIHTPVVVAHFVVAILTVGSVMAQSMLSQGRPVQLRSPNRGTNN